MILYKLPLLPHKGIFLNLLNQEKKIMMKIRSYWN